MNFETVVCLRLTGDMKRTLLKMSPLKKLPGQDGTTGPMITSISYPLYNELKRKNEI